MFDPVSVRAEDLAVTRGGRILFEELRFQLGAGESLALRGPNGSGKTTLLRTIAGFLRPSVGEITFDGAPEPQLAIHYLGHKSGLKAPLDLSSHVEFWANTLGQGVDDTETALERVGLAAIADLPAGALSQGQSRRLAMTRLIVAPRPIWLLDEPAAGLDTRGKALLDALIAEHLAAGGLIVAALHEPLGAPTTHSLEIAA